MRLALKLLLVALLAVLLVRQVGRLVTGRTPSAGTIASGALLIVVLTVFVDAALDW